MAVAQMDIELQRNASYVREWGFTDAGEPPVPLDLTGAEFALDVKASAGDPDPPIASATFAILDAPGGIVQVSLSGADFAAVEGEQERVVLAYDCIATQDDTPIPIARGALILLPGVS